MRGGAVKIKNVRELYLRWTHARNQCKIRPDAVCSANRLKDNSIWHNRIDLYVRAANVIHERFTLGKEELTSQEQDMIKIILTK